MKKSAKYFFAGLVLVFGLNIVCAEEQNHQTMFFEKALKEYAKGNYEKAVVNLKIANVSDPANEDVKEFLIRTLFEMSQKYEKDLNYIQAIKCVDDVLAVSPDNTKAIERKKIVSALLENQKAMFKASENNGSSSAYSDLTSEPSWYYYRSIFVMLFTLLLGLSGFCFILYRKNKKLTAKVADLSLDLKIVNDDRNMLLTKLVQSKEDISREKISLMAQNLYDFNPGQALTFLGTMVKNSNPTIRANVISALATLASGDTIELILQLYNDKDPKVKGEALKSIKELGRRVEKKEISVDVVTEQKLKSIVENEKSKKEWIF